MTKGGIAVFMSFVLESASSCNLKASLEHVEQMCKNSFLAFVFWEL